MESPLWSPHQQSAPVRAWRRWLGSLAFVFVLVASASGITIAILLITFQSSQAEIRLDIIKTGLAVGAGVGALITLMSSVRGQLLAEQTAQDLKADATEKRVIELYSKGIEQFGSDKLAVRIGGLYALERLAENTPDIRDRVVDVVCAYLRTSPQPGIDGDTKDNVSGLAAQKVLIDHLAYQSPFAYHKNYWAISGLTLSGAVLNNFDFQAVKVDTVWFDSTVFRRQAFFAKVVFRGAGFPRATFEGPADFEGAHLGHALFAGAKFGSETNFNNVRFYITADFTDAQFSTSPSFDGARILINKDADNVLPLGWEIRLPSSPAEGFIAGESGSWAFIVKSDRGNDAGERSNSDG
jgi:hypothetical protein